MQTLAARVGLTSLNIIVFFIEEAWIIAAVAILPFWLAVVIVTTLLSFFAISSSYLCGLSDLPDSLEKWLEKQKEKARARLAKVVRGAAWTASLATAIVISPTTSAVMLHLSGIKGARVYATDILFSVVSGVVWCVIYGGGILVLRRIF